jgi:Mrp family chromosome partitioning ATPase
MHEPEPLVRTGARPGLEWGDTAFPRHRAPYARHVVVFTSGKGGVGKSTVAVNVASALGNAGQKAIFAGLAERLCAAVGARPVPTERPEDAPKEE